MAERKTVIALGFFDGIHIGHAALVERAKERAAQLGARPAVLTFDEHPDTYVKKMQVELINSAADRSYILDRFFGLKDVYYIRFNEQTMRMDWRQFIESIIGAYSAVHFVVGHDFRFGYKGLGTAEVLRTYCVERGLGCDIIEPVTKDGVIVSSTYIRGLLAQGEMARANEFLGHPHLLTDTVRSGYRLGRSALDAPTINMCFPEGVLVPRRGVYVTRVLLPEGGHTGVTNIGVRPTFGGSRLTVETNILDFSADLYGQRVCVEFHDFIRPERKFDSPEELMRQIKRDGAVAREHFLGG
ncbi:MAG: bifunctional riboflavin kinase/FAD synthetase [Oscillospiraceae bacterium]